MAPQAQSVEIPKRFPLVTSIENRDDDTLKDAKLVNAYAEKMADGSYQVYKRAGLSAIITDKTGNGYGTYNWLNNIYAIFGTTLYKDGTSLGTVDGTGGVYCFVTTRGATPRLVMGNGVKAYTYEAAAGLLQITDVDFPTAFVKGWAYLDATLYVMDSSGNIWGSDLNNPTSWTALNKIVAQVESDAGVALAKQLVYVIAFKQWSTEVFYDAANSTGSPLGTVQGAKINYGCASADSIQEIDGILLWVSTNRTGTVQVLAMDGLKALPISTKPIERLLEKSVNFSTETVFSWQLNDDGHRFYVLTFKTADLTIVYDITEKMWYEWDTAGVYFPIVSSTYDATLNHIVQGETDGNLYYMGREYTTDTNVTITVDIVTPNFDGGVRQRKVLNFLEIIGDQVKGSLLKIRKSDDDYQTWSNFRTVDLSKKRPFLTNCGTFYRRVYNFRHESNTRMRLQAAEMQIDLGVL